MGRPFGSRDKPGGLPKGHYSGRGPGSPITDKERAKIKEVFLYHLSDGNSVTYSAKKAGVAPRTAYMWRGKDPEFAVAWDDALEQGTDGLEDVALKRAKDGSDPLLMFLLKSRRKEVYVDSHSIKHVGHDGGAVKVEQKIEDSRPPMEELFAEFQPLLDKIRGE
jgi:hypothetical protein